MKRLYFLTPNITSTKSIVEELKEHTIPEGSIHVVGKNHQQIERANLHEANLLQTTDFLPALKRGTLAGGTAGFLAGLVAITFPPADLVLGGGALMGISLFGAGFGAWVSTMIGVSIPDPVVNRLEKAIESGDILMIIDIPASKEQEINTMIKKHHPEAKIETTTPPNAHKKRA